MIDLPSFWQAYAIVGELLTLASFMPPSLDFKREKEATDSQFRIPRVLQFVFLTFSVVLTTAAWPFLVGLKLFHLFEKLLTKGK